MECVLFWFAGSLLDQCRWWSSPEVGIINCSISTSGFVATYSFMVKFIKEMDEILNVDMNEHQDCRRLERILFIIILKVKTPFLIGTSGINAIKLTTSEPSVSQNVLVSGWGTLSVSDYILFTSYLT